MFSIKKPLSFYKALDFEIEHFGTYVWSLFTELAVSFIRMD